MATISGIPLFYPLMKNPCVFPANPNFRLRTGNVKSEALAMCFFVIVIFSSYDLFQNGFWTSYNRGFGTIMHVNREFKRQSNLLEITYNFDLNGENRQGKAYLLNATDEDLELYENGNIWNLSQKDNRIRNIDLKPKPTTFKYGIRTFNFNFYTENQLNDTLSDKIVSGEITSNFLFLMDEKLIKNETKFNKLASPKIKTIKSDLKEFEKLQKIALLEAKLTDLRTHNGKELQELQKLQNSLKMTQKALIEELPIYERNKYENDQISITSKIANYRPDIKSTSEIQTEIELLRTQEKEEIAYFSGTLSIYNIPKNHRYLLAENNSDK
jgi:inner membrane protein